jgi:hypothetical protein
MFSKAARRILTCNTSTVFGKHKVSFKRIFDAAQTQLRAKFGMEMKELPQRERVTLKDRRGKAYLLHCFQIVHFLVL